MSETVTVDGIEMLTEDLPPHLLRRAQDELVRERAAKIRARLAEEERQAREKANEESRQADAARAERDAAQAKALAAIAPELQRTAHELVRLVLAAFEATPDDYNRAMGLIAKSLADARRAHGRNGDLSLDNLLREALNLSWWH